MQHKHFAVILFCLSAATSGCMWCTFMPITSHIQKIYNVSLFMVYYHSLSYMAIYAFTYLPSNYTLDRKGLRTGVCIGITLTAIGTILRSLIGYSYTFALIGQTINAIAQPFILNADAKLAREWYPPEKVFHLLVFSDYCYCKHIKFCGDIARITYPWAIRQLTINI
jgi:hypothetical protein